MQTSIKINAFSNTLKDNKHLPVEFDSIFCFPSILISTSRECGAIQRMKLIIGLIRGIGILMRHSAMGPLKSRMWSCVVLTRLKLGPPRWILLSSETHYPNSMMQFISKCTWQWLQSEIAFCLQTLWHWCTTNLSIKRFTTQIPQKQYFSPERRGRKKDER